VGSIYDIKSDRIGRVKGNIVDTYIITKSAKSTMAVAAGKNIHRVRSLKKTYLNK
jgi:hypothetical protein